jgi:ribosomal protein S17E
MSEEYTILAEECGELTQACCKRIRYGEAGYITHYCNLISDTEAPVGIIGNTLSSFSTQTSRK